MNRIKPFFASLILLVIYIMAVTYLAVIVPADAAIPIHWNARGEIDSFIGKTVAVPFALGLNVGLFLLLFLLPYYSPRYKQQAVRFDKVLPKITLTLLIFFSLLNLYMLAYPLLREDLPVNPVLILIGLMFMLLGNFLPKVPRNFFVGIRTPWSISSEDNWNRTHRVGGRTFLLGGFLMVVIGVLQISPSLLSYIFYLLLAMLLYPVLFSFVLFLKRQNRSD